MKYNRYNILTAFLILFYIISSCSTTSSTQIISQTNTFRHHAKVDSIFFAIHFDNELNYLSKDFTNKAGRILKKKGIVFDSYRFGYSDFLENDIIETFINQKTNYDFRYYLVVKQIPETVHIETYTNYLNYPRSAFYKIRRIEALLYTTANKTYIWKGTITVDPDKTGKQLAKLIIEKMETDGLFYQK